MTDRRYRAIFSDSSMPIFPAALEAVFYCPPGLGVRKFYVEMQNFNTLVQKRLTQCIASLYFTHRTNKRETPQAKRHGPKQNDAEAKVGRNARQLVLWAQCGSTRSLMAPSQISRRCCLPHLRGICPAKEHQRARAAEVRRHSGRSPVRQSAVHGVGKGLPLSIV